MADLLSLKAYAQHRKCDPKAVRQALKSGRISAEQNAKGFWMIDAANADADWEANTRPDKAKGKKIADFEAALGLHPDTPEGVTSENSRQKFFIAMAEHKIAVARLAEIELRVKSGELLDAKRVHGAVFDIMRQVRDAMLNIPDRCAADIAAESDPFEVNRRMLSEIRMALSTMAAEIEKYTELPRDRDQTQKDTE